MAGFQCGAYSDSRTGPNRGKTTEGGAGRRNTILASACSRVCAETQQARQAIKTVAVLCFIIVIYETVLSMSRPFYVSLDLMRLELIFSIHRATHRIGLYIQR